ncbi:hypothetical protein ACFSQ7_20285 [Paenibacillus rhizoplanae]
MMKIQIFLSDYQLSQAVRAGTDYDRRRAGRFHEYDDPLYLCHGVQKKDMFGMAAAQSMVFCFIMLLIAVIQFKITDRKDG